MQSNRGNLINQLKSRIGKGASIGLDGNLYQLAKELGCIGDIIGREYKIEYNEQGQVIRIIQIPMRIITIRKLFNEAVKDNERQEKAMKSKRR